MKERRARIPRLFTEAELRPGARLVLPREAAHHAARVLRLRPEDPVILFNGRGGEFEARIASGERGRVAVEILAWREIERESPLTVTLVQGVSSGEKMDFTIQKAVELGAAAIQPVLTARSVVRLPAGRGEAKLAHWRRIAIATCEQCGRNRVAEVRETMSLDAYCRSPDDALLKILLSPEAKNNLKDISRTSIHSIVLAAGPEAGFSAEEEAMLVRAGFAPVRLGPRVLRTETAALAALAALNALRGDF